MTKNEKLAWVCGAVIAVGFAVTVSRHGRKKSPSNQPSEVATESPAPRRKGGSASKINTPQLNDEQRTAQALSGPAYEALMKMNLKQDTEAAKVRGELEKTFPAKTIHGLLAEIQKTMVNGKPTAATKKLAAEYLQRPDVRAATTILEAHNKNNDKRGKETVDGLDPALVKMTKTLRERHVETMKKKQGQ